MPHSEDVTVLVINEQADEIKLVTLGLRGFFPNCRVEATYSVEEALTWAPRAPWDLILIDEHLSSRHTTPVLPELKRLAPTASIVLQSGQSETAAALAALQAGADFLLYKHSPAFLTELLFYAKHAVDAARFRLRSERAEERHARLIEALTDIYYELDADGRFVHVSSSITALLGYSPEELLGMPYTILLAPDQQDRARHRFNDRRSGVRASRRILIDLSAKDRLGRGQERVPTEISASGLYDAQRRYQGTIGLIRDLSRDKGQENAIRDLERRVQETDRMLGAAQRLSTLSAGLQAPLAAILSQSQQLLGAIRETRLDHHLETLTQQAAEAVRQGQALADAVEDSALRGDTINELVYHVLDHTQPPLSQSGRLEFRLAANLPAFKGPRADVLRLLNDLVLFASRYLAATGSPRRLRISTFAIGSTGTPLAAAPSLFPAASPTEVEVDLEETRQAADASGILPEGTADIWSVYELATRLGGRLEFTAPAGGLLTIRCWLPVWQEGRESSVPIAQPDRASPAPQAVVRPAEQPARPAETLAPDRRKTDRLSVHLPAAITIGDLTRAGAVQNISVHGAQLAVEGAVPSLENQRATVVCKTGAGNLELRATAHHRGVQPRRPGTAADTSLLALRFTETGDTERKVLSSLIEAARERVIPFAVEVRLALPEGQVPGERDELESELRGTDHREAVRVRTALPIRLESSTTGQAAPQPMGLAVNVSRHGACLVAKSAPGAVHDLVFLHFASTGSRGQPRAHEPAAPEAVFTARIVWIASDRSAPADLRPSHSEPGQRIGVQFVHMTPFAEREINRVVAQHVGSAMDLEGITGRAPIVSARRECRNARDQVIAITDDHARHQISPNTPIVVLAPGFSLTQSDYIALSFFLATNRLRVLRYDHTNHVGQSDGDSLQITLRSMQVDLDTVVEFARSTWPTAPLTILAEDLAARVALKVAARLHTAHSLLLINPVLDVQQALATAYRHDVLQDYQHGLRRGVANLWGLNVNLDQFLGDVLAGDYAGPATTTADLAALSSPPVILTSPLWNRNREDTFGPLEPSLRTLGTRPTLIPLPGDLYLYSAALDDRHLAAFTVVLKQIVAHAGVELHPEDVREPVARDIHRQRQLEDERIRIRHHVSQATRDALWVARLAQLSQLEAVHNYWLLLEELYRQTVPLEPGMTIADLGCGHGDMARVLQTNLLYRAAHQDRPSGSPVKYIGLEHTHEALHTAQRSFRACVNELTETFSVAEPGPASLNPLWIRFDWDAPLPLADGTADRMTGNLFLSFVPSPLTALRHALSALSPNGILAVTCFQPHTDLSFLYRRHLRIRGEDEFSPSAQILLHYFGRIREALRHGVLHSFERSRLTQLLIHAGAAPSRIVPLLDGQLLLVVARKGKSAG